jgi:SAM-dependent methyltransferase
MDLRQFADSFGKYRTPVPTAGPAKYVDAGRWLRQAAHRYLLTGLAAQPPGRRIFDLGAGPGYFPLICRTEGHDPLLLDVDDEPLYREIAARFGLPRIVHRIAAFEPLPDDGGRFDLITAFKTCFNVNADGSPWDAAAWAFLLEDLRARLNPGGQVVLWFNVNPTTGELYPRDVARLLRYPRGFQSRVFFEYAVLRHLG